MARREMEMTNAALKQDQNKVKQLMERFDSLMAEGRHRLAEESAAFEAEKIVDRSLPSAEPTMVAAAHRARFRGAYDDIMAVRVAKQKGFVDAMYQTEKSHVPVADDPPIVYPDAEVWKELTARRKEKYSSTDLSRRSPAEKKIDEALKQPTQIEFVETPLEGRRRLSQGPAPHRDPARFRGLEGSGRRREHAGYEESQGHFAPLGLEAVAG